MPCSHTFDRHLFGCCAFNFVVVCHLTRLQLFPRPTRQQHGTFQGGPEGGAGGAGGGDDARRRLRDRLPARWAGTSRGTGRVAARSARQHGVGRKTYHTYMHTCVHTLRLLDVRVDEGLAGLLGMPAGRWDLELRRSSPVLVPWINLPTATPPRPSPAGGWCATGLRRDHAALPGAAPGRPDRVLQRGQPRLQQDMQ